MRIKAYLPPLWFIAVLAAPGVPAAEPPDELMSAMLGELDRSMQTYGQQGENSAYFIGYRISDTAMLSLNAQFGSLVSASVDRKRAVFTEVRLGNYSFDNTHVFRRNDHRRPWSYSFHGNYFPLPLSDDEAVIRNTLWYATHLVYQDALEAYIKVRANKAVKVEEEDQSPDFSQEPPVTYLQDIQSTDLNRWVWENRLKRISDIFNSNPQIFRGEAALHARAHTRWQANSEGTRLRTSGALYRLDLIAVTKAEDGMELPLFYRYLAKDEAGLPSEAALVQKARDMVRLIDELRIAPVQSAYEGPAIIENRASGVFFHEALGHRVEGHRLRNEMDAQTFKKKLNESILPSDLDIYFDPLIEAFQGKHLMGHYRYDEEAVAAQRVQIVDDGKLVGFLMSRTPVEGMHRSNGHGRAQTSSLPVSRQSNLFVESSRPLSKAQLQERLLELVDEQNKPYGIIVREAMGGATNTSRHWGNTLNVVPTLVYRLYPDGRQELVRGANLIGTPLVTIAEVMAVDEDYDVFQGWCGAESGYVPVSTITPNVLVGRIEFQRNLKSPTRPPILPSPTPERRPAVHGGAAHGARP